MDRENSPINCLLEQAASIARRSKNTAGTLEPTESYKRRQIKKITSFTFIYTQIRLGEDWIKTGMNKKNNMRLIHDHIK